MSYDVQNRLTRSTDSGWSGLRNFGYDSRGNVISAGQLQFAYDSSEQPVAISGTANGIGNASGSYRYDGNFKRVKQQVNGNTIYSVYDRAGGLVHLDAVTTGEETDYIAGPKGTLARIKNDVVTYLHPDILGSAQSGTNSSGAVQWREQYTPFGEELQGISANANQAGYTGHIRDATTGLSYMQARYYDPVIGRFYSNDPADVMEHIARGNPIHGFNRYTYANNNPYKYVDPDGEFGLLGAAIGAFVGGVSSIAVQSFTGDGKINWSTVGAATATGAAVGATGGLAGAAVAKIGLTGAEAAATVLLPSSGVAAVGGALTQMFENTANGDPLNKGVALSAGAAATGTIVGGVTGDKIVGALTKSPVMGEAGKLAGGKATGEAIATATQEGIAQGITNSCTGEICE